MIFHLTRVSGEIHYPRDESSQPPYALTTAQPGGIPTGIPDDIVAAALIPTYLGLGFIHLAILISNKKRGHKFSFSSLFFSFSLIRTTTLVMRIVWAANPDNVQISMAAAILTSAGAAALFVMNLFFTQRMVRAYLPAFGWSAGARTVFRILLIGVVVATVMLVAATVHFYYTLENSARRVDRYIQLVGGTFFAVVGFLPIPIVTVAALFARFTSRGESFHPGEKNSSRNSSSSSNASPKLPRTYAAMEKFGQGRHRTKVRLLLTTSFLLAAGATYRVATNYAPQRPVNQPGWWHHRVIFYTLNFGAEIIISALYAAARFDRRFHVPDGGKGPGDLRPVVVVPEGETYTIKGKSLDGGESGGGNGWGTNPSSEARLVINTEAEAFGPGSEGEEDTSDEITTSDWLNEHEWLERLQWEFWPERVGV